MKIQLRKCPLMGEIYAILQESKNEYECYCLNDDTHFSCNKEFILRRTKKIGKIESQALLPIVRYRYNEFKIELADNLKQISKY